jgi:glucose-6-phosphate isomerase
LKTHPFGFDLSANIGAFDNHLRRPLSDLEGYFADVAAYRSLRESRNPVVYEVYERRRPEVPGELLFGLSVVHPGVVGNEYFMTKGHFHAVRDTAEFYYCLRGQGIMLMEDIEGEWAAEELQAGRVVYVTPGWAHRSINVSSQEDLVTLFVCPAHAGHDYGAIAGKGFRKLVLRGDGGPTVVDNPAWSSAGELR